MTKEIYLDIEISDFFEFRHFQSEEQVNANPQLEINFQKILMSGELEEEMMTICRNGGII